MSNIYEFKVVVEGLEGKVWRTIEVTERSNVARLAYTLLASFNTAMYHLYQVEFKDRIFDCQMAHVADQWTKAREDAKLVRLRDLNLKINDEITMDYDFGTTWSFSIVLTKIRKMKRDENNYDFPKILQGQGYGIIEDTSAYETLQVIKDIDQTGVSEFYALAPDGKDCIWDYRDYSVFEDNMTLIQRIYIAIVAYEETNEY